MSANEKYTHRNSLIFIPRYYASNTQQHFLFIIICLSDLNTYTAPAVSELRNVTVSHKPSDNQNNNKTHAHTTQFEYTLLNDWIRH